MTDLLASLNPHQRQAAEVTTGPVLILAGAGSGKTRVITHRIAHLIQTGVNPYEILAVTFTNKAAGEMKERIAHLLPEGDSGKPTVSTFHSLCVRMLRRNIERMGLEYTRSFVIYDSSAQERLTKHCIVDLGADPKKINPRDVHSTISGWKNKGRSPETIARTAQGEKDVIQSRTYALYEQRIRSSNAMDFDDLLLRAVQMLEICPDVRAQYHNQFKHMMVDEFQDTNGIQYRLMRLLAEGDLALSEEDPPSDFWANRSLCVVGDDGQAIYGFRGSDFKIILNFGRTYKNSQTVKLEDNYRSTGNILAAANAVIEHNTERYEKTLRANNPPGDKIRLWELPHSDDEARVVVDQIQAELNYAPEAKAAILYRTNAQSRPFEEGLRRAGIKYCLVGGLGFYERAEIKDIVAYLTVMNDPNAGALALTRIINTPARGIGDTTVDKIEQHARMFNLTVWQAIGDIIQKNGLPKRSLNGLIQFHDLITRLHEMTQNPGYSLPQLVKAAMVESGYKNMLEDRGTDEDEGRLENLGELENAAAQAAGRGEDLLEFLDQCSLVSDQDELKDAPVTLMTVHASKGLEFPLVFVVGMEQQVFPHSRSHGEPAGIEEERRLFYVAITRAMKKLWLSTAKYRRQYGETRPAAPSMFLDEVPAEVMEKMV